MVRNRKAASLAKGIFAALPTAFDQAGNVDEKALCFLVRNLLQKGVEGFYVGGSTGECFLLSEAERKEVLEIVLDAAEGKVPVIAHVGAMSTIVAVSLAQHAAACGASAVSATPPFYFSYNLDEIYSYYADIAEASGLPVLVYNIPAFSGRNFGHNEIDRLLDIPGVAGLKHTSMNLYELERIRVKNPDKILFSGYDEVFLPALVSGADGMIGSTVNLMPELFLDIKKLFILGDIAAAQKLQAKVNSVIEALAGGLFSRRLNMRLALPGCPAANAESHFFQFLAKRWN